MNFNITEFNFPIYGLFILLSLIIAAIFVYINLSKKEVPKRIILLSLFMNMYFSILGGKLFTVLTSANEDLDFLNAGLSSYGGAIGLIIATIIFNQIYTEKKDIILSTYVMTLPLIYSISKLGCFFAGCCNGVTYEGIFHINYDNSFIIQKVFPVQLLETIVFMVIFFVCNKYYEKDNRYIKELVLIMCGLFKFILDFLRESHIGILLSINQIVSMIFIVIGLVSIFYKTKFKIEYNSK